MFTCMFVLSSISVLVVFMFAFMSPSDRLELPLSGWRKCYWLKMNWNIRVKHSIKIETDTVNSWYTSPYAGRECGTTWMDHEGWQTSRLQIFWHETIVLDCRMMMMMMSWCLMSSNVIWHIRDKLWPMPKHGSVILYVHGNQKAR